MPRKKNYSADFQQKLISKGDYRNFARVHYDLFYDERFIKLSATARLIYIAMIIECGRGESRTRCKFPHSAYTRICSKETFHRSKKELIQNGFITEIPFRNGAACIYKLCGDWKLDIIPKREPVYYDACDYKKILRGDKNLTR